MDADRTYGISGTGLDWELDWTAPWEHLVEEFRTWPLLEAFEAPASAPSSRSRSAQNQHRSTWSSYADGG
ncbi:hypothetical protein QCN29_27085 [Streptomyces sp. HNM0663]|uniref:Uncharacterized protein n=1 Tax=Streptomyces chengmaiensis TaxID=3040919 RepID=A0ABT6HUH9_9ACTN|nr:hypothetical protein [Streptomyces chengmaiensis]MDH2392377.1 hypothetical protein [Streptomyces chengmaiensis]